MKHLGQNGQIDHFVFEKESKKESMRHHRCSDDAIFLVYVRMYNVMVGLPLDKLKIRVLPF